MISLTALELKDVYTDAFKEVIATLTGFELEEVPGGLENAFPGNCGMMRLGGDKYGILLISSDPKSLTVLCSYITGVPTGEITPEELDDTLGELVNLTAGGAKVRLNDTNYMLSIHTPITIRGDNISLSVKKRTQVLTSVLRNDEISVGLTLVY
jgi:CheY-specific phosphatase CheX